MKFSLSLPRMLPEIKKVLTMHHLHWDFVFFFLKKLVYKKAWLCVLIMCVLHYLNVEELLAQNSHDIWNLSDCNGIRTQNHLVCKQKLNHSTNWLWIRIPLQSFKPSSRLSKILVNLVPSSRLSKKLSNKL